MCEQNKEDPFETFISRKTKSLNKLQTQSELQKLEKKFIYEWTNYIDTLPIRKISDINEDETQKSHSSMKRGRSKAIEVLLKSKIFRNQLVTSPFWNFPTVKVDEEQILKEIKLKRIEYVNQIQF